MTNLPITRARITPDPVMGGYSVEVVSCVYGDGNVDVMQPLVAPALMHLPAGSYIRTEPAFGLTAESAQVLLDALWEAGLRPSKANVKAHTGEDEQTALAVELLRDHLADLRRMVFGAEALRVRTPDEPSSGKPQF